MTSWPLEEPQDLLDKLATLGTPGRLPKAPADGSFILDTPCGERGPDPGYVFQGSTKNVPSGNSGIRRKLLESKSILDIHPW